MSIYSAVKSLAADQGKSIYKIEHDLNLSNGTISKWNKSVPQVNRLQAVADYLGVSIPYLLRLSEDDEHATNFKWCWPAGFGQTDRTADYYHTAPEPDWVKLKDVRDDLFAGKSPAWIRLYIFDTFPEVQIENGQREAWVKGVHGQGSVTKIYLPYARGWMHEHHDDINWTAKMPWKGVIQMGPLLVIMAVFLIALVVNNVLLTERCHRMEMKLRNEHYKED